MSMTKTIINATHKGGEGKTTNSIMLAEYASLILGKKTLIIDMDPQANISGRYLKMEYDPAYRGGKIPPLHPHYEPTENNQWDGRSSIANIFYAEAVVPYPTSVPNLELLPAYSYKLQEAEMVTKSEVLEKVHLQLQKFLSIPDLRASYEVIVIDTPPSKGPLTIAAIKAATHLVIPTQMEQFSIEGIYGMLQLWKQETYARGEDNKLELIGILPNKVRNINLHKQFLESLKKTNNVAKYIIPYVIKERAIYTEILVEEAKPNSLFNLPKNNAARQEYEEVCSFIIKKVFSHE